MRRLFVLLLLAGSLYGQEFEPMSDAKGYMLHFFLIDGSVDLPDSVVAFTDDTLRISWHQPKRDDSIGVPLPSFYPHRDTVRVWIPNDSTLYKYFYAGNDSSCWYSQDVSLKGGAWELAITCIDLAGNVSQYSEPFTFGVIAKPGQPYEINIILKRKQRLIR